MKVGIWYWHTPFQVTNEELGWLKKIGVSTIYVRTATFTTDGVHVKTMIPQSWKSDAHGMPVVLTFNFDTGLRSHFEKFANASMAADIAPAIARFRSSAKSKGIRVTGIQMDVDCPTRLLPKYASLIRDIRSRLEVDGALGAHDSFSATALQTWLNSGHYQELADACDFVAPQFYEGRIGRTIDTMQPAADAENLANGMARAESAGRPYFVGIATYGHALLFNRGGQLVAMYHGMQPEDALRHPSLQFEVTYPMAANGKRAGPNEGIGENLLVVKAVHPDINGRGLGFRIAYVLPTAEMLARELKIVRESASSNCQGVILYRFPEAADELNLPLETMAQSFAGKPTSVEIDPSLARRSVPWSLIGTGRSAKKVPCDYTLTVKSTGTAPTMAAPGAVSVVVAFDGIGLEGVEPGDFDRAQTGVLTPDRSFQPCAPAHANAVLFERNQMLPGAKLRAGAIEVGADGPSPVKMSWVVDCPNGKDHVQGSRDLGSQHASKVVGK
ncbi:MAG: DUF3142 domain-containing protein [Fimbriimonas sp.]|nr:DUF3142 domain-containing protein [Fimbriimonas sp.]